MSLRAKRAPSLAPGLGALSLAAALAACATTTPSAPQPQAPMVPPGGAAVTTRDGVTPPFMAGRTIVRVGLLLPFSTRPQEAAALYNAAELALFDHGGPSTLLIPRDAGANSETAAAAARALLSDGANIIIGPVTREGVEGAASAAARNRVPVIGFSSDRTVAGSGVYLLSFQLEDEVSRLVSFAAARGLRTVALLAPDNEYGRRVEAALRAEAARQGMSVTAAERYTRTDAEAGAAAGRLAATLSATPAQGIVIADSGTTLRAIGPALVRGGVDPRRVRLLGTSVWAGDAQREPTFAGGWYVSPDPRVRTDFEARYQAIFHSEPTRLSSLAYDAVALSALLSSDRGAAGFTPQAIQRNDGFLGSDGIFRFRSNGSIQRGLAIMEVRPNDATPVDPAPRRFTGPAG
ncbi:MAG: penicillin-binding protein activator [Hyphomonadaceae bacterium]